MINKPAVFKNAPYSVTATKTVFTSPKEVSSIHYLNTTAGVGRIDIQDENGQNRVTLGSDAANGNDDWTPGRPVTFNALTVTFTTGTGVVTILAE